MCQHTPTPSRGWPWCSWPAQTHVYWCAPAAPSQEPAACAVLPGQACRAVGQPLGRDACCRGRTAMPAGAHVPTGLPARAVQLSAVRLEQPLHAWGASPPPCKLASLPPPDALASAPVPAGRPTQQRLPLLPSISHPLAAGTPASASSACTGAPRMRTRCMTALAGTTATSTAALWMQARVQLLPECCPSVGRQGSAAMDPTCLPPIGCLMACSAPAARPACRQHGQAGGLPQTGAQRHG